MVLRSVVRAVAVPAVGRVAAAAGSAVRVRGVTRATALLSFLPVPPLAIGSMPVTPGVMLAEPSKAAARLV